jgi:AraC-like DNA-binding protein
MKFAAHLAPYLIFELMVYVIQYSREGASARIIDGYIQFDGDLPSYIYYYGVVFALSGFLYPLFCLLLLNRHSKSLRMQFSFVEDISLNWLKLLILGALGSFLIGFTAFELIIGGQTSDPKNAFYIVAVVNTMFIFILGYFGLRQPNIFTDRTDAQKRTKYQKSGLDDTESQRIAKSLDVCMHENKLYLNSRLTLADLANELGTSANRLSQVLNGELGTNFYDYINGFRIREVQNRIVDPEWSHLTFLGIALESGFNSKSSFNKLFKENTGLTPSEYKKQKK